MKINVKTIILAVLVLLLVVMTVVHHTADEAQPFDSYLSVNYDNAIQQGSQSENIPNNPEAAPTPTPTP